MSDEIKIEDTVVTEEEPRLPRHEHHVESFDVNDLASVSVGLASPEMIRN